MSSVARAVKRLWEAALSCDEAEAIFGDEESSVESSSGAGRPTQLRAVAVLVLSLGVPEYFDIPDSEQPPGSSMIARLQLKDPNSDLNIGVDPGTGTKYHNYGKRQDLSADSPFTVYIRNLPDRYVMVTSFDPQLITTQHNNRGKRNIWFHRGDNSVTLNLTHVSNFQCDGKFFMYYTQHKLKYFRTIKS
ncbi:hypothetical protein MRX96_039686 [Rhipicephalus microplus]